MVSRGSQEKSLVSWVVIPIISLAALFLLLLVSEVAMTPPLLAPHLSPDGGLRGTWKGTARIWVDQQREIRLSVDLTISRDGTVKGLVGQSVITGRLERNRSWIGRTLNLRTDYIIVGDVTGFAGRPSGTREQFTMPLNFRGDYFKGSMFVGKGAPSRVSLFKFGADERSRSNSRIDII